MCSSDLGNVRELEHWIESAIVLAPDGLVRAENFPSESPVVDGDGGGGGFALPVGLTLEEAERRYVAATVAACDGNKAEAARRLGIGRNTLARALSEAPKKP